MMAVPYKDTMKNHSLRAWLEPEDSPIGRDPSFPSASALVVERQAPRARSIRATRIPPDDDQPHKQLTHLLHGRRRGLTIDEATYHAIAKVRGMREGDEFTSQTLLPGARLRGDPRGWSQVINALRRKGMIMSSGLTREIRRSGKPGFTAKWRVTERTYWED